MSEGVYYMVRTAGEEEYGDPLHDTGSHSHYELQHPTSVFDTARVAEQGVYNETFLHTEPQDLLYMELTQPESVYETVRAAAYKVSSRYIVRQSGK